MNNTSLNQEKINHNSQDIIALSSSILCAIHCAILPAVLTFSSLSSLQFLKNPYIEWTFILLGLVFVFTSLLPSYQKLHQKKRPLQLAILGFVFIALARLDLFEFWEPINTVLGASLVAFAHFLNWKLLRTNHNHKNC